MFSPVLDLILESLTVKVNDNALHVKYGRRIRLSIAVISVLSSVISAGSLSGTGIRVREYSCTRSPQLGCKAGSRLQSVQSVCLAERRSHQLSWLWELQLYGFGADGCQQHPAPQCVGVVGVEEARRRLHALVVLPWRCARCLEAKGLLGRVLLLPLP